MNRKILLIDIDSTIPNLALMKISAYHKSCGYDVSFTNTNDPDVVYASVIFKKNKHDTDGLRFYYPNSTIIIGGSGYSLDSKLPDNVDLIKPDYDLYPSMDYSIGYTTRGCNRNCTFCIVQTKEGRFHIRQHPQEFFDERFDKIVFLDNNILLNKKWFFEVMNFCNDHSLTIDFNQGLDIRLVDNDIAKVLSESKFYPWYRFAFDSSDLAEVVANKCKVLQEHGINIRSDVQFYVYCNSDAEYDDVVWRCRYLKNLNTNAFVQYNIDSKPTKRVNQLRRWANRKWAFWSCDIGEYTRKHDTTKKHR